MTPLVQTPVHETEGTVSPDGRWLAHETTLTGSKEIYVRPFPNVNDGLFRVSTAGGTRPLWAHSGKELFFVGVDGSLLQVSVEAKGATWNSRAPVKLFERRHFVGANSGRSYDVSPDGQRFLMIKGPKPTRRPRSSSSNTGTRSSSAWRPRSKGPASHYSAPSRNRVSCNPNRYTPAVCPHFRIRASNLSWATEQRRPRVVNGTDMTGSCSRAFCLRRPTTRT